MLLNLFFFFFLTLLSFLSIGSSVIENQNDVIEGKLNTSMVMRFPSCISNDVDVQCVESVSSNLVQFYEYVTYQENNISLILGNPNWMDYVEGNCLPYFNKVVTLQKYAQDPRVETICEIGFNAGYSAISMLLANTMAKFYSFDIMLNNYTSAAIQHVYKLFPERDILVIAGNSKDTIKKANSMKLFEDNKCNLVFVDGDHRREGLLNDLYNIIGILNTTYHRVIVDDIEMPELANIWLQLDPNKIRKHEVIKANAYDFVVWQFNVTSQTYDFYLNDEKDAEWNGAMGICSYIL